MCTALCCMSGKLNRKFTKIMQNNIVSKMKRSKLEIKTGHYVYIVFFAQLALCVFASLYHILYVKNHEDEFKNWIDYRPANMLLLFIIRFGNWILISA